MGPPSSDMKCGLVPVAKFEICSYYQADTATWKKSCMMHLTVSPVTRYFSALVIMDNWLTY